MVIHIYEVLFTDGARTIVVAETETEAAYTALSIRYGIKEAPNLLSLIEFIRE